MISSRDQEDIARRRKAARRTAWILALIVLSIFGLFLYTGITGRV